MVDSEYSPSKDFKNKYWNNNKNPSNAKIHS